jgi:hypothetical protein
LQIIHRVIATFLTKQSGRKRSQAHSGAVTLIQRFGSAANLNIHLHWQVADGVYRSSAGERVFHEARAPSAAQLEGLLNRIIQRIVKLLARTGYLIEEQGARYLAQAESDCALTPLQALHLPHCAGATRRAKGAEPANRPQPPRCASRSPRLAHKSAEQTRKPQVSGPTHPIHGPLPPRQCALRGKVAFQILMRNGRLAGAVWMVAQTPRALAREDSQ